MSHTKTPLQGYLEGKEAKHDLRIAALNLSALMLGPQTQKADESAKDYLNRFTPLAEAIEHYVSDPHDEAPA